MVVLEFDWLIDFNGGFFFLFYVFFMIKKLILGVFDSFWNSYFVCLCNDS